MAVHFIKSDCERFQKCCIPSKWLGLMIFCGMAVKKMGMLAVKCVKLIVQPFS
jgi:hypothetical protein